MMVEWKIWKGIFRAIPIFWAEWELSFYSAPGSTSIWPTEMLVRPNFRALLFFLPSFWKERFSFAWWHFEMLSGGLWDSQNCPMEWPQKRTWENFLIVVWSFIYVPALLVQHIRYLMEICPVLRIFPSYATGILFIYIVSVSDKRL